MTQGFPRLQGERPIQHMPIAVDWRNDKPYYVSSGDLMLDHQGRRPPLRLGTVCRLLNQKADRIESIDCIDEDGETLRISASTFVLATGSIAVPQLVHGSGLDAGRS